MRRFVLPTIDLGGTRALVTGDAFRHMTKVLRLREGTDVVLCDGNGTERCGTIDDISPDGVSVLFHTAQSATLIPPDPAITIYQGLPKGDKIDFIVQKATELGAAAIVPFSAERSVKKVRPERSADLGERWERIAREAARQSGRAFCPEVRLAPSLVDAVAGTTHDVKLILWEEEHGTEVLRETLQGLQKPATTGIVIGPEGGLSANEVAQAVRAGFIPVSLGSRILRTETASLAILTILQYCWGDLGC